MYLNGAQVLAQDIYGQGPSKEQSLDFKRLSEIIHTKKVTSIDQLIPLLPKDYRDGYTLMHQSDSLQSSTTSPTTPRAILFGDTAKFVLTFTSSNSLELMEWNEKDRSFEFREMLFDGKTDPLSSATEINPQRCVACHGSNARPNWDAYNTWPGAYGSLSRFGCDYIKKDSKEAMYLEQFRLSQKTPRYLALTKPIETWRCETSPEQETFSNGSSTEPNAVLTQKLSELNLKRLQKLVEESPQYENYKFAIAYAADCYPKIEQFSGAIDPKAHALGPSIGQTETLVRGNSLAEFNRIKKRFEEFNGARSTKLQGPAGMLTIGPLNFTSPELNDLGSDNGTEVTQLRFLFDRLGINWNKFTLGFKDGDYNFSTPGSLDIFKNLLATKDQNLLKENPNCEELIKLSLAATANAQKCEPHPQDSGLEGNLEDIDKVVSALPIERPTKVPELERLNVCLRCHNSTDNVMGLNLQVQSPELFKSQLLKNPSLVNSIRDHLRGRTEEGNEITKMPLNAPAFTEEEQKMVNEYIRALMTK